MKSLFVRIRLSSLLLCMGTIWLSNAEAQALNAGLKSKMQKISDAFKKEETCLKLIYLQQPMGEEAYIPLSTCEFYKKGDWERAVFKEYETMRNEHWYVKAEHESKKLYLIKLDEQEEMNSPETVPVFNESILEAYQIEWDSAFSKSVEGYLKFKGLASSNYESLGLNYDPKTFEIKSYTIRYKQQSMPGMQALTIEFQKIDCSKEELYKAFSTEYYFKEEKGVVQAIDDYKNYQLIKNF